MATERKITAYFLEQSNDDCGYLDTCSGGDYNFIPGGTPPKDEKGEEMPLLFQINFNRLPNLEGFPETGLMQVFVAEDYDNLPDSDVYPASKICFKFCDPSQYENLAEEQFEENIHEEMGLHRFYLGKDVKYTGAAATMQVVGENIQTPLGCEGYDGVILGGLVTEGQLYGKNLRLFKKHPEYSMPLLRINPSENDCEDIFEAYWFFVKPEEFKNRNIQSTLLLILTENDWD